MSVIKLKKGLDIKLQGKPVEKITELKLSELYGIKPDDFRNVTPKIIPKVGDKLKAGSPVFYDKNNENFIFTSPVSGVLEEVRRGERRKILEIIIKSDNELEYEEFNTNGFENFSREQIVDLLLKSGLWTRIVSRPYGIIPQLEETPKSIHVSTFDTAPVAVNYNFTLKDNISEFQTGIDILKKLTSGDVNVNIDNKITDNIFSEIKNAKINKFEGKHPAGNVGIQIHHLSPINKGEKVWTLNPQDVVFIGRFFKTGKVDLSKTIALSGYGVEEPQYYKVVSGCQISSILSNQKTEENVRIISGNVLTGKKTEKYSFLGYFDNTITIISEGNEYEMFGWAKLGWNRYTATSFFLSKLRKNKEWKLNTNLHGGKRPFVLTGKINKVLPMNILPIYLIKACMAEDIEKIENLGIYEVIEEDLALCEFVSETKIDFQEIIGNAIKLMISEMGV